MTHLVHPPCHLLLLQRQARAEGFFVQVPIPGLGGKVPPCTTGGWCMPIGED